MTTPRRPAAERLMNLVIALSASRRPVTRTQIRQTVAGYETAANDAAFERMFERDKDALRELGIPLKTVTDPVHEDQIGYLVDASSYELAAITLTPQQATVAALAASLWRDAALHGPAERGLTKLRAVGAPLDAIETAALDVSAGSPGPAFNTFLEARRERKRVTFKYRAASTGQERERKVEPWGLIGRRGAWYLIGNDINRDAPRAFRLDRIVGSVRASGPGASYEVPADVDLTQVLSGAPNTGLQTARVLVPAGKANALRFRAEATTPHESGGDVLDLTFVDIAGMARTIATYGADALVLEPAPLRAAVLRLLRGIAAPNEGE